MLNEHNKDSFVKRRLEALLPHQVHSQFNEIRDGFNAVIPLNILSRVTTGSFLRAIVFGEPVIDVEILLRNIGYYGFRPEDQIHNWMTALLRSFNQNQLRSFLEFITGNGQVGTGTYPRIQIHLGGRPDALPMASTCFHQLHVPLYPSLEFVCDKAIQAITEGTGVILNF